MHGCPLGREGDDFLLARTSRRQPVGPPLGQRAHSEAGSICKARGDHPTVSALLLEYCQSGPADRKGQLTCCVLICNPATPHPCASTTDIPPFGQDLRAERTNMSAVPATMHAAGNRWCTAPSQRSWWSCSPRGSATP